MRLACLVLLLSLSACGGSGAGGGFSTTVIVTNLNNAGAGSLREAVDTAPAGALIVFDASLPADEINLFSPLEPPVSLTISGLSGSSERMHINAQGNHRAFEQAPGTTLELRDLQIANGSDQSGGGVRCIDCDLILRRVVIENCQATVGVGGGVYMTGGHLEAVDCSFLDCSGGDGGAVYTSNSEACFSGCSFYGNHADVYGAGIAAIASAVEMSNCIFLENTAQGAGGALYARSTSMDSSVRATYCTIVGNAALGNFIPSGMAGGFHVHRLVGASSLEIHASIATGNTGMGMPDLHVDNGATAVGTWNRVGVGPVGSITDGVGDNSHGTIATPLNTTLVGLQFDELDRAWRVPTLASGAAHVIPPGTTFQDHNGVVTMDHQARPRSAGGAGELGAVERK